MPAYPSKRCLDLGLVLATLPFWLPLLGLVCLVQRLVLGPPVFFRQLRPGLRGLPFTLLKLRTMSEEQDRDGAPLPPLPPLPEAARLGRFGRFLRRTSLDELPELFCVLRGEMSLVGPRPLLMEYLPLYSREQARRHEVLPGLTGLAQISGRNELSWEETFRLDVWYVDHASLTLDLKILALTLFRVVSGRGAARPGQVSRPKFAGSGQDRPLP